MSYGKALTVAEVVKDIFENKYIMPSIQREFVWSAEQIETLFDSLMQGYPIGTFLFWEVGEDKIGDYQFYGFLINYHEKDGRHNERLDLKGIGGRTAILDGQQRLTSLYIGLKGSYAHRLKYKKKKNDNAYPVRKLYLNLVGFSEDERNKCEFSFLTEEEVVNNEKKFWFEVGKVLDISERREAEKNAEKNIKDSGYGYTNKQIDLAKDILLRLFEVICVNETISYYKEKSRELDKVLNIFIRVNSGGTVLSYSDLLLSIASALWETDARKEIIDFVNEVNDIGDKFNINKDFVLKTALVLSDLEIAFKVDNFNKENMKRIESAWEKIKRAIRLTFYLVASFGYSRDTLSSNNALIPIAYYLNKIGLPDNFSEHGKFEEDRKKIKSWLIASLLQKAFSGQPDNVLNPIRRIINESEYKMFPYERIVEEFRGKSKSIVFDMDDIDQLLNLKYGDNDTLSTLMILYPSFDFANRKFQIDHMYPKGRFNKKYLRENGVPENMTDEYMESVNNICNLQLLPAAKNNEKQDTDFDKWFKAKYETESDKRNYRETHYLPDMEYSYPNFKKFIEKRREILRDKLKKILIDKSED